MGKKPGIFTKLNPLKDRRPVQRRNAADHLLVTLLSFAASVGGTRLFLEITGFPQLGGGELHIAHVLWGGLFLFAASLLPLIIANEWVFSVSALVAGFGIGFFIDEVGKFITQTNDYFYPSAAPIVYVVFLLTVFLFSQIQKRRQVTPREKLYGILNQFGEVLDHDLSADEFEDLIKNLDDVINQKDNVALIELAQTLKNYVESNRPRVVPKDPTIFDRIRITVLKLERKWLTQKRMYRILFIALLVWGGWALISPIGYLLITRDAQQMQVFLQELISNRLVRNASGLNWFEARVLIEGGTGIVAIISALFLVLKKEKLAIWIGIIALLVTLTLVDLLIFYFDQFSTILLSAYHFLVLVLLVRYERRFLEKNIDEKKQRA